MSSASAPRRRPLRWATTAQVTDAASRPSEFPSAVLYSHQGESAVAATAAAPAQRPPSRVASVNAPASPSSPPARATISHSAGVAEPNSASGVVNSTGNGFQDGPLVVSSASRPTSRPHTDHAHGSNASAYGPQQRERRDGQRRDDQRTAPRGDTPLQVRRRSGERGQVVR